MRPSRSLRRKLWTLYWRVYDVWPPASLCGRRDELRRGSPMCAHSKCRSRAGFAASLKRAPDRTRDLPRGSNNSHIATARVRERSDARVEATIFTDDLRLRGRFHGFFIGRIKGLAEQSGFLCTPMELAAVLVPAMSLPNPVNARADDETPPAGARLLARALELAAWLSGRDPILESQREKVEVAKAATEQARVLQNPQFPFSTGGDHLVYMNSSDCGTNSHLTLSCSHTTNFAFRLCQVVEVGRLGSRRYDVAAANSNATKKLCDDENIRVDNKDSWPVEQGRIELETEELGLDNQRISSGVKR